MALSITKNKERKKKKSLRVDNIDMDNITAHRMVIYHIIIICGFYTQTENAQPIFLPFVLDQFLSLSMNIQWSTHGTSYNAADTHTHTHPIFNLIKYYYVIRLYDEDDMSYIK